MFVSHFATPERGRVDARPCPGIGRSRHPGSSAGLVAADSGLPCGRLHGNTAPGSSIVPKPKSESIERIVEELMECDLSKAERMKRLRELAQSGEDVPDELMDQALRKLMERITE